MKTAIKFFYLSMICLLFIACENGNENGGGKLAVSMTYKSVNSPQEVKQTAKLKSVSTTEYGRYTQFGYYITSITPSVYVMKFLEMRFLNYDLNGQTPNSGLALIHSDMANTDSARFADFTNNNTINVTPNTEKYDSRSSVKFNIFAFSTMLIYHEFELPAGYADVPKLDNLTYEKAYLGIDYKTSVEIGGQRNGLIVKGSEMPFIKDKLFQNDMPHCYVFGSTDSTYVCVSTGQNINDPLGQWGHIVRSNKYNALTIPAIPEDQTLTLKGTMSFDYTDLIQVYAGADNIPYTSDDIFVYAPKYWERLSVNMTLE